MMFPSFYEYLFGGSSIRDHFFKNGSSKYLHLQIVTFGYKASPTIVTWADYKVCLSLTVIIS